MDTNTITLIKSALKADVPILLEGHTGTGKTYTILELAKSMNKTVHVINVSGELTVDSILGQQIIVDGNIVWRDGVLTTAMKNGDWVLFDEMNTALPEVLTVINGVLDDSRSVTLPNADNERVRASDDFRFIGTQNPASGKYAGTARLNDALLNRMVKIDIGFMSPPEEIEALKKHTKKATAAISGLVSIAHYTRNSTNFDAPISTRDLVKILRLADRGGMAMKDAISAVLHQKYSEAEYEVLQKDYDSKMHKLSYFTNHNDEDPIDYIHREFVKMKEERDKIERDKKDLRALVESEITAKLMNYLGNGSANGISNTAMPEGF